MPYSEKEISSLIKITRPEIIYSAQTKSEGIQLLKRCQHQATNYQAVITQIKNDQGGKIEVDQVQFCQEAANAAILNLLNSEHQQVIELSQDQKQSLGSIFKAAKVASVQTICNMLDTASDRLKDIAQLENSRDTLLRYNNAYRGQKTMTLELLKIEGVDPEIVKKVKCLYKPQSVNTLIPVWQTLTDWDSSETLKLLKNANAFAKLKVINNAN